MNDEEHRHQIERRLESAEQRRKENKGIEYLDTLKAIIESEPPSLEAVKYYAAALPAEVEKLPIITELHQTSGTNAELVLNCLTTIQKTLLSSPDPSLRELGRFEPRVQVNPHFKPYRGEDNRMILMYLGCKLIGDFSC